MMEFIHLRSKWWFQIRLLFVVTPQVFSIAGHIQDMILITVVYLGDFPSIPCNADDLTFVLVKYHLPISSQLLESV